MNLSFKKYLVAAFLIFSEILFAQHSGYYIKNYGPKTYGGYNQMWAAIQDKNGLIYFAGTSAVYVFNGTTFQEVPVKSGSANRQIAIDSTTGIIYIGAVGDFGYLERDSLNGKIIYKSLTNSLSESQKIFSDIWKVAVDDGKIYFQSAERIFICEGKKVIGTIEAPRDKGFALLFRSNGKLLVRQRTVGLMEIINGKLQPLQGGERFANSRILGIIPWKSGQDLILSGDSGFFLMNKIPYPNTHSCFIPFAEKVDTFLINHSVLG